MQRGILLKHSCRQNSPPTPRQSKQDSGLLVLNETKSLKKTSSLQNKFHCLVMYLCNKGYWMAFASRRAVCLFLQAQAVIKFVLQAASYLENADGNQRNLFLVLKKGNIVLHQVIWLTSPKRDNWCKAMQNIKILIAVQTIPVAFSQLCFV